ncbi:MAG: transglutaminase family protein [Burkholderiaceae bacterium]|nr:transglutaminase family protein [Burkholderiaceae bacterium]
MQLAIRHETHYRYSSPFNYTIQQLRLTPRTESQQRILSWQVDLPSSSQAYTDAYGNFSHMLTLNIPQDHLSIIAHGHVETVFPYRGRLFDNGHGAPMSPQIFTASTRLTEPTPAIIAFCRHLLPNPPQHIHTHHLMTLAEHVFGAVAYQSGATNVDSTAHDAFALGQGVCQDHAHLFLACCHAKGISARYVSGYIDPGNGNHGASHAWVDAWVDDPDFSGWISIDVTHKRLMTDAYCRLAIGRDYESAAPIHGVRSGGGEEHLSVSVWVQAS